MRRARRRYAKGQITSHKRQSGWRKPTMISRSDRFSLPLSSVLHFYEVVAAIESFIFLSRVSDFASAQRIRSIIASKVARRAGGKRERRCRSSRSTIHRESSRPGIFIVDVPAIDLERQRVVRWEEIAPAKK